MPIYEYECTQCHEHFEYQQRMTEDPKSECESCGGKLNRLISRTAFHLKGGGWYKDLYSSAKPSSPEGSSPAGSSPPASDSGSSSPSPSSESGSSSSPSSSPSSSSSSSSSGGSESSE